MNVVAVSQRVDHFPERHETRDALDQRLSTLIATCGFVPIPIPNALGGALRDWLSVVQPAAMVLSGGNDIGQCAQRDDIELALLAHAPGTQHAHDRHLPGDADDGALGGFGAASGRRACQDTASPFRGDYGRGEQLSRVFSGRLPGRIRSSRAQ